MSSATQLILFLLFSFFLSFSTAGFTSNPTELMLPGDFSGRYYIGGSPSSTIPKSPLPNATLCYTLTDYAEMIGNLSYSELISLIREKAHGDYLRITSRVWERFRSSCDWLYCVTSSALISLSDSALWILVYVWATLFWSVVRLGIHMARIFAAPICALTCMYALTRYTWKALLWIFGSSPAWIVTSLLKTFWMALWSNPSWGWYRKEEKAVEGFTSFSIPQNPPRNCVVEFVYPDGSHLGYGVCLKLFNGTNALATAAHVAEPGVSVRSLKTGSKIALSEFKETFNNKESDLVWFMGPPNWEGLLGVKAAQFETADRLGRSGAMFYTFDNDAWVGNNAKLVDGARGQVMVLSNTCFGVSGTPYFNGKTVLGVHSAAGSGNYNLMSPIPPIPGVTCPEYKFETTAPQGRIFSDSDIAAITKAALKIAQFQPKGKAWADYSSDDDSFLDAPPPVFESAEQFFDVPLSPKKWVPSEVTRELTEGEKRAGHVIFDICGKDPDPLSVPPKKRNRRGGKKPSGNLPRQRRLPKQRPRKHPRDIERAYRRLCPNGNATDGDVNLQAKPCNDRGESYRSTGRPGDEAPPATKTAAETAEEFRKFFHSRYTWSSARDFQCPGFTACGSAQVRYHAPTKSETKWGRSLCTLYPELEEETRGFGWPQFGEEAELKSLALQATRWQQRASTACVPSEGERLSVIDRTVRAYSNVQTETPVCLRGREISWQDFLQDFTVAVKSLELDAGIGVPYIMHGRPTHRGWVEDPVLLPILARLTFDRLQKMSKADFEHMSAEELVREGLCDPVRLFVKGEPHKTSKLDEGRYRLIMSISLVDQLVARVLFQQQNKLEIALWRAIPSKPGFGLSTDGQVHEFLASLARQVGVSERELLAHWREYVLPTDCSGFDWSVSSWMMADEMEVRNRLTMQNTPLCRRLRAAWLKCIENSVLCTSGGLLLSQKIPGVQKSGSYNTSSTNSRVRVMAAYHCGAPWVMAMGDDALESPITNLRKYADLGFKVEVSEQLEFCSHVFEQSGLAIPVNTAKMLYKLIHGYEPECGNFEVQMNYIAACFSVLNELRHLPSLVDRLYPWLLPALPQKIPG
ncbi:TPA_asm: P1-P2 fusion protein [Piper methysticum polerovirus]|nr:TPA_asm: P1-P2 fusion protein [Piper methysticum polerovirus]